MTEKELKEILEKHRKWLSKEEGGEMADLGCANLRGADLRGANLSGANLRCADLGGAYLRGADLGCANLRDANLSDANLSGVNLCGANLRGANLCGANLRGAYLSRVNLIRAYLRGADLRGADLRGANLSDANLSDANLSGVNLCGVKYDEKTAFFAQSCPEEGAFIGFKKAGGKIVKLLIPEDAKRSSATSRKCRCSKATVLSITNLDGSDAGIESVPSDKTSNFVYKIGKTLEVKDFDEDRWNECSTGIHFFITRDEAVNYN